MTDDIIRMAREAGYFLYDLTETHGVKTVETDEEDQWAVLKRFADLVAAAQKEKDAQICDAYGMPDGTSETSRILAEAIRRQK
jgi:hypothetical protein